MQITSSVVEKIKALMEERTAELTEQKRETVCLYEAQIQFNKNRGNGFGNILILAGGAGSGKGFVLDNLVGLHGKVLDVDQIKKMALAAPTVLKQIKKHYPDAGNKDFMKDPENVSAIHNFVNGEKAFPDRLQANLFNSIIAAHPDRKPNLIFDITLKDGTKLINLLNDFERMGYDPKKVHMVWVLNEVSVAVEQNKARARVVPEKILLLTHEGAALTMKTLIKNFEGLLRSGVDGDVYIAFNKAGVDSLLKTSDTSTGKYVEKVEGGYVQLKEVGKALDLSKLSGIIDKIRKYVPEGTW